MVSHPILSEEILVGNIIIEFDDRNYMATNSKRSDLTIIMDGKTVFNLPLNCKFCQLLSSF